MLLKNRQIYTAERQTGLSERMAWRLFKRAVLHRGLMNAASGRMKNFVFEKLFTKAWGERRSNPVFASKSFNQLWKEQKNKRK